VATKTFGSVLSYANATTFTFTLIGDSYGTETTWSLKNQAGTTLYSGGPYSDIATGTQTLVDAAVWTLPANGCYYLTVNDSYGDGLYDGVSQGSYTITAGTTTVVNVTDFVVLGNPANTLVSRQSYFTNNAVLESDSFELFDSVSLYPNPAKDRVTISIPQGIEVIGNFDVYNAIGQKITSKNVTTENDLTINTNNYQAGMYFINLTIGEYSKTLRFIKE
jgi:hypothetical protein